MEEYRMILESQLGPREGLLQLNYQNGSITGTLTLLGHENPVSGEWTGAHSFRLSHHLHTLVSDLSCVSQLELEGDKLVGTLQNGRNRMQWHGEKVIKPEAGSEHYDGA